MKVTIDCEECTICGLCWDECPEFFEQNAEDEWSQVVKEHRIGDDIGVGDPRKT